jgi:hypothetical protein
MHVRGVGTRIRTAAVAAVAAAMVMTLGSVPGAAASSKCGGTPIAVAETQPDDGHVGKHTYYMWIKSELYRCGGYVQARHWVYFDASRLPLGTAVHVTVGTRRSDGKWHGRTTTMESSQNISADGFEQRRGVGGGLTVTHVRIAHIAAPDESLFTPPSKATATYVPWNGPEASPRDR